MKTVKKLLSVFLSVLMLLTLGLTAFAANEAKIEKLDNSTIDGSMWMIAGGEDELYIYPRPDDAKDRFDIFTAVITSSAPTYTNSRASVKRMNTGLKSTLRSIPKGRLLSFATFILSRSVLARP